MKRDPKGRAVAIDMIGRIFGKLVVCERAANDENGFYRWRCLCVCGRESVAYGTQLRGGATKSCGCGMKESQFKPLPKLERHARRKASVTRYQTVHGDEILKRARNVIKRQIKELRNAYVARLLCASTGLRISDIPETLIEAKRVHLKLLRLLKEKRA